MASEEGDSKYVSPLDDASKKICHDELHERNEADTLIAVQTFRQWIHEQKWLKTPTDYKFLLRFLRFRKFSELEARKALEHFWTVRTRRPTWFTGEDPTNEIVKKVLKLGIVCSPRQRDKHGRRVIFGKIENLDVALLKQVGMDKLYRTFSLFYDWMMWDERCQVEGVVMVTDYHHMTLQMFHTFADKEFKKEYVEYFHHGLPIRLKSMNGYREPHFFDLVYAFVEPFLPQKMKDRFHLHGQSMVKLYKDLGYECFPNEYLPDDYEGPRAGTYSEIVDEMVEDMSKPEFLEYIRDLSSGHYGVDKIKDHHTEEGGSFRKIAD
ncbi:retinaldehyde-binding protein 1-like [Mya arenaria]|uniref:retinaldehyde-binding protein 1-like n=1 Tax=Mya arenaria TaxID=6604 RepID=UPI0022E30BC1|nr:retinaldehyde-binding protein 1-like [Mya arenaria]